MASKRAQRRKECSRKRRFETHHDAAAALRRLKGRHQRSDRMSVYRCRWCGGYHFGHTPLRVRLAIEEKIAW